MSTWCWHYKNEKILNRPEIEFPLPKTGNLENILWNHMMQIYKDFDIYVTFGAGGAPTTLTPQALSTQYTYVAQWTKKYLICMKFFKNRKLHDNFIDKSNIDLNI